jgi:Concanavalin A-like lectin/glucanases superfamily
MDNSNFSTQSTGRGSGIKDFMNSSSLVARISFLLLVIIIFVIVLQFSISILAWFFGPNNSPKLINGMVDAKQMLVIPQDPSSSGAKPIIRSVNGPNGIEFTWSVWVFIDDTQSSQYRHIFSKGNANVVPETGLNFPNNAPGLYIVPNTNAFKVIMNTYNDINEEVIINDIPLNKWINVIIRCKNTTLDIYINGTITKSLELSGVPKQNYGDVYVGMNGGFSGYVSNLWYYDYSLGTSAIYNLVKNGPNTKMVGSSAMSMKNPNYLSVRWFFAGAGDQFNPLGTGGV